MSSYHLYHIIVKYIPYLWCNYCFTLLSGDATFDKTPQNAYVYEGNSIILQCSVVLHANETAESRYLLWKKDGGALGSPTTQTISQDETLVNNYHITSAAMDDGAKYTCESWSGNQLLDEYSATLVVLGKNVLLQQLFDLIYGSWLNCMMNA